MRKPITKYNLWIRLEILKRMQPRADYSIDWFAGQPCLKRKNDSISVSPRGPKRDLWQFMGALIDALDIECRLKQKIYQEATNRA